MNTDWESVVFIAAIAVLVLAGFKLIFRGACRDMELLQRRFTTPQRGAAPGAGVEREPSDVAALPRSPQESTGAEDPRPSAPVGARTSGGAAAIPVASPGLHARRRVAFRG